MGRTPDHRFTGADFRTTAVVAILAMILAPLPALVVSTPCAAQRKPSQKAVEDGWRWLAGEAEGDLAGEDQPPAEDTRVLDGIKKEIAQIEERISRLEGERETLLGEVERLDLQAEREKWQIAELSREMERTRGELELSGAEVERLETTLAQQRRILAARLAALYRMGRLSYLRLMLSAGSAADVRTRLRYLSHLAGRDSRLISDYSGTLDSLSDERAALEARTVELSRLTEQHRRRHRTIERLKGDKERLLSGLSRRIEDRRRIVQELDTAAAELESFIRSLGDATTPTSEERLERLPPIDRYQGLLPWPVPGEVVETFGQHKHPRFGTTTISNGIVIESPPSTPVRAVYFGTVAYNDWFHGYGKLVILDHGDRAFTLYAHLEQSNVSVGEWLNKGDMLGTSGSTGSLRGPVLYFEIRVGGEPVNPEAWLGDR